MNNSSEDTNWREQFKDGLKWLKGAKEYVQVQKEIQKQRYSICQQCDSFVNMTKQCSECACFMPLKTRMNIAPCPKGKWNLI